MSKQRTPSPVTDPAHKQSQAHYLRTREAAGYLRVSPSFLNHMRLKGDGPPFRKLSSKLVVYYRPDLDEWSASRSRTFTSRSHDE